MILDDDARIQPRVTVTVGVDPQGTLSLVIDGVAYPCTWDGVAIQDPQAGSWFRRAHLDKWVCGPFVAPGDRQPSDLVLNYGAHPAELRLNIGGTIVVDPVPPILVRTSA